MNPDGRRYRIPDGFFVRAPGLPRAAALPIREIPIGHDEYPEDLRTVDDPPDPIWIAGRDLRSLSPRVAVIGARAANQYGLNAARRIAGDLAVSGVCVVSGMARGCDAAAHDGALDAGGVTIAVLGSGADVCYPAGSRRLYAEIAARGAIVSPFPPGHQPRPRDFVRRNAVLVGLSRSVVVAQGGLDSAAVATGGRAAGTNRNVYAVPGPIDWPQSAGVHDLIAHGATLCAGADVVLKDLRDEFTLPGLERPGIPEHLPGPERAVLEALAEGATSAERLVARTGLDAAAASRALGSLELKGLIGSSGRLVVRLR